MLLTTACGGANKPDGFSLSGDGAVLARGSLLASWTYRHQVTAYSDSEIWGVTTADRTADNASVGSMSGEGLLYAGPSLTEDGFVWVPVDGTLYKFTDTGVLWTETPIGAGNISTSPSIDVDGNAIIATDDGAVHAVSAEGDLLWTTETPGTPFNRLAIGEDGAIFGLAASVDDLGVKTWAAFALESDGAPRWDAALGIPLGSPVLAKDGSLLVSLNDAPPDLAVPDPSAFQLEARDPATGELVWEAALGLPGYAPVVQRDGTIVVAVNSEASQTGDVVFINDRNGNEQHRTEALGWLGQPTVGSDGRVYVGCDDALCSVNGGGKLASRWELNDEDAFYFISGDLLPPLLVEGHVIYSGLDWDVGGGLHVEEGSWSRLGANAAGTGRLESQ